MLTVSNVAVQFRGETSPLFKNVSFTVNAGERVGLIGPNGAGKTTLIKALVGQQDLSHGSVIFMPSRLRVGYLAQGIPLDEHLTIREVLFPFAPHLEHAEQALEAMAAQLADAKPDDMEHTMHAYDEALGRVEHFAALIDEGNAERLMKAFDLSHLDMDDSVQYLSGGQKTRLNIIQVLLNDPHLLILDEPTNHLDIVAIEWLETWLRDFEGGVLLVSHDRTFMDRTVTQIVALENGSARVFPGNYSDYVATVQSERDKQWAQWRDEQVEIARLQASIRRTADKALKKEHATKNDVQRRYAKKVAKLATSRAKKLEKYINAEDRADKPDRTWQLKIDLPDDASTGQEVITTHGLAVGYEQPLLSDLELVIGAGERIIFTGPNGHGKSTLLKTLIGQLEPLHGNVRLGARVKIGYLSQAQDTLPTDGTPLSTIQAITVWNQTEVRSFLHFFLFSGDAALRPNNLLSYGERSRLMLAQLVAQGANVLALDEPINHLDVASREQFEEALSGFPGCVIAIAHDRYFIDRFATSVWYIEDGQLEIAHRGLLDV